MANSKDLDYTPLFITGGVMLFTGAMVGVFFIAPMIAKNKQKAIAAAKKPQLVKK